MRHRWVKPGGSLLGQGAAFACFLLTALLCLGQESLERLVEGSGLSRSVNGQSADVVLVALRQGQFVKIVAMQSGTDVKVTLRSPQGRIVTEVDSPNGAFGPETLVALATASGDYQVETRLRGPKAGTYQIRLVAVREAGPEEQSEMEAHRGFAEGVALRTKHNAESRRSALEVLNRSRTYFARAGDAYYQAFTCLLTASIEAESGDTRGALDDSNLAVKLFHQSQDLHGEANAWSFVGGMQDLLGDPKQALDAYQSAIRLYRKEGATDIEASMLNNIGKLKGDTGDWQGAIDFYSQALSLLGSAGNSDRKATLLRNLGFAYSYLGDFDQSVDLFEQALALNRTSKDLPGEARTLAAVARTRELQGLPDKALAACQESLRLYTGIGDRLNRGIAQRCVGRVQTTMLDFSSAERSVRQAIETLQPVQDRRASAQAMNDLARVLDLAGKSQEAAAPAQQALAEFRALGDRSWEESSLALIAHIERDRGNFATARERMEESLKLSESNRSRTDSEQLRASMFATRQESYSFYIDLLVRLHENGLAFEASERSRARSLVDMLAESAGGLRAGVDPQLLARQKEISDALNAKGTRLLPIAGRKGENPRAAALREEIAALERDYQEVEGAIRRSNPRYAALTQPDLLGIAKIQSQVLDRDTLLLEYALGEERSYLWVVGKDSFATFELPSRAAIEERAQQVYEMLCKRADREFPQASSELSEMVLGPAKTLLGNKRLAIIADGGLQRIPFAALPSPGSGEPLIVRHEITVEPSASALALLRQQIAGRRPAPKMLAVFADPVFDRSDPRLTGRAQGTTPPPQGSRILAHLADPGAEASTTLKIPRLPYTAEEALQILRVAPNGSNLRAFDFQASRAAASDKELANYRYLHFATHGYLDTEHPDLSALVLSQFDEKGAPVDGFLRVPDVYNSKIGADLVVLSACQTGLGKEIRGEGVMGLTRAFLYAGAPRVIVSLWNVNDHATAELMGSMYRNLLKAGKPASAALRSAQLEMLKQKRWESPYYWAAFVENGEWR